MKLLGLITVLFLSIPLTYADQNRCEVGDSLRDCICVNQPFCTINIIAINDCIANNSNGSTLPNLDTPMQSESQAQCARGNGSGMGG